MSTNRSWIGLLLLIGALSFGITRPVPAQSRNDSLRVYLPEWKPSLGKLKPEEKRQLRFVSGGDDTIVTFSLPDKLPKAAFSPGAAPDTVYTGSNAGSTRAGKGASFQGYTAVARGQQTDPHYAPNVQLILTFPDDQYLCSGTLIDAYHVLTAGHCVYHDDDGGTPTSNIQVSPAYWGNMSASGVLTQDLPFGQDNTSQFFVFRGWMDDEDYDYDLAVVRLNQPLGVATGYYGYGFDTDANILAHWYDNYSYPGEAPFDGLKMQALYGTVDQAQTHFLVNEDHRMKGGTSGSSLHRYQSPAGRVIHGVASHTWYVPFDTDDRYTRITGDKYAVIDSVLRARRFDTLPDLVAGVVTADVKPIPGGSRPDTLDYTLHNYGEASWSGTITARFYLSTDAQIDTTDLLFGQEIFTTSLAPGAIQARRLGPLDRPTIPHFNPTLGYLDGPYFIGVILDAADADAGNNTSMMPAPVTVDQRRLATVRVQTTAGNPLAGVTVNGLPNGPDDTDGNGLVQQFTAPPWNGTVTFQEPGYDFSPPSDFINLNGGDQTISVTATLRTHRVQGHVRLADGTPLPNVEVDGFPNGAVLTDASGAYDEVVDWGTVITLTPRLAGYNMSPASASIIVQYDVTRDFTATPAVLADSPWPQFNAAADHTGRAADHNSIRNQLRWQADVGGAQVSSVSIGLQGEVYVGNTDGTLYAFTSYGTELWQADLGNRAVEGAPVAASGERVYAVTDDGKVWVVDHTGTPTLLYDTQDVSASGPTVGPDGTLYVGGDHLYAIAPDGTLHWTDGVVSPLRSQPAVAPDGTVYVGGVYSALFAFDPATGALQWQAPTGGAVYASPAVDSRGHAYVGTQSGALVKVTPGGAVRWQRQLGGQIFGSPALDRHGNVYVGTTDGDLFAYDSTGVQLWTDHIGAAVRSSPVVTTHTYRIGMTLEKTEELLYVGADDGKMYSYSIEGQSYPKAPGARRWAFQASGAIVGSPALGNGTLYFGAGGGPLYALQGINRTALQVTTLFDDVKRLAELDSDLLVRLEQAAEWIDALLGGPDDPCGGGPLILPPCFQDEAFGFGSASPFVEVMGGEKLAFDLATDADAIALRAGEAEGLLATLSALFEPGRQYAVVVAGVSDPRAFAPNPDGRDTGLALFAYDGLTDAAAGAKKAYVYAGHFSPDAAGLSITLEGDAAHTFEDLHYGDFGKVVGVPPGVYQATLRDAKGTPIAEQEVDLTGTAGQAVGLYAAGFRNPGDNLGGPALGLLVVPSEGTDPRRDGGLGKGGGLDADDVPTSFALQQNYPNPFNPATTIAFTLPEAMQVSLVVYDVLGRQVARLADRMPLDAGVHQLTFDAAALASGTYVYRLEAGPYTATRRMVLVK